MSSESDGNSEMEIMEDDENWTKAKRKNRKAKRKRTKELTQEEINNVILGATSTSATKTPQINTTQKATSKNNQTNKNTNTKNTNFSPLMKEINQKKYQHLFYITIEANYTRINFTDYWGKIYPNTKDIILKTKLGLLLKTDTAKESITNTLNKMIELGKILRYTEPSPNTKSIRSEITSTSYSVVIGSVEQEIEDQSISDYLNKCKLEHRYCKRIISRTTNNPTSFIRIITSSQETSTTLLTEGLFFKYRHYPVYPSKPPPPAPKPCNKCFSFEHATEDCKTAVKCSKCLGNHSSSKCTSTLPPKCNSCHSDDHQAWSYKCPNRPKAPIQGVPNIQIKSLNKKSHEISSEKKKSRIHQPITMHDTIINTYINELNNPANTDREELLTQLRKRFMYNYRADTTAVFTGNRVYILIFDMELQDHSSPTELINQSVNFQYEHVAH